jgi:hypothetical protein
MTASQAKSIAIGFDIKDQELQKVLEKIKTEANEGRMGVAIPHAELNPNRAFALIDMDYEVAASTMPGHWLISWR